MSEKVLKVDWPAVLVWTLLAFGCAGMWYILFLWFKHIFFL